MINEYDYIVTVEFDACDGADEKAKVKEFKQELYDTFPSGTAIAVEGIKEV
ncbi:hypothetical protein HN911_13585 [Candidatus Bathyarchaeota archaeon]|mgnify:CR=1 FL=1|jgi:hypothetical protein|nr:hypothetical protein [Candidatus Bathyarchaeota archaeon]